MSPSFSGRYCIETVTQGLRRFLQFLTGTGLLIVLFVAACAKGDDRGPPPHTRPSVAADTAQTSSATRESPLPLVPFTCDTVTAAICLRDTAFQHEESGYSIPVLGADWILFGAAGDSIEIYASPDKNASHVGRAYVSTNFGHESTATGNTAPYRRLRLTTDGIVSVWVTLDSELGDSVGFTLMIHHVGPTHVASLQMSGRSSKLAISSASETDRFSVVPASLARSVRDLSKWTVFPRPYKVALVPDSVYEICRSPCMTPDTAKLTAPTNAIKRY